jgi:hypothetical protein
VTKRYDRLGAHARLVELMGPAAPAKTTMPAVAIAYEIGPNGKAIYDEPELVAYANRMKARSIRRMGGRRRSPLTVIDDG